MITFPDPLAEALRILRASTDPELLAIHFGTETPDSLGDDLPGIPYVSLDLVSTDDREFPFTERATLSLTAWAGSKAKAQRTAQVCRAALVDFPGDAKVGSVTTSSRGPTLGTDPESGQPIALTYITLRLRPIA